MWVAAQASAEVGSQFEIRTGIDHEFGATACPPAIVPASVVVPGCYRAAYWHIEFDPYVVRAGEFMQEPAFPGQCATVVEPRFWVLNCGAYAPNSFLSYAGQTWSFSVTCLAPGRVVFKLYPDLWGMQGEVLPRHTHDAAVTCVNGAAPQPNPAAMPSPPRSAATSSPRSSSPASGITSDSSGIRGPDTGSGGNRAR